MSMFYAPYFGTALVLGKDEAETFIAAYCKFHDLDRDDFDELLSNHTGLLPGSYSEQNETIPESLRFPVSNLSKDDGASSGISVSRFTETNIAEKEFVDNAMVFWADRSRLNPCAPPAYASTDDLIAEFKDKLSAYLPDDFDYENHLGFVSYCCFA